jgi:hypothetical protein
VRTDRTTLNNKPDNIIRDNKKGTCTLLDAEIPGDRNVIKKDAEKILKNKDLIIEIQRMWNVKAKVAPVIVRVTGTISESLRQYLSNIPGKHKIEEIQKSAILGTARVLKTERRNKSDDLTSDFEACGLQSDYRTMEEVVVA